MTCDVSFVPREHRTPMHLVVAETGTFVQRVTHTCTARRVPCKGGIRPQARGEATGNTALTVTDSGGE